MNCFSPVSSSRLSQGLKKKSAMDFSSSIGRNDCVSYFESQSKPIEKWVLGTEYEKFIYRLSDFRPLSYEEKNGISDFLKILKSLGWKGLYEKKNLIALFKSGRGRISLEPGGQIEFSTSPSRCLYDNHQKIREYLKEVDVAVKKLKLGLLFLGYQPKWKRNEMPWMPKKRYQIMKEYMPSKGNLGLDMMLSTCSTQINLDYSDEKDMVLKFRVSLALQPVVAALFAHSPFLEGKPNGFQSYRAYVWSQTDSDRYGDLSFVFEEGFGFERYTDYILNAPMYFIKRNNLYTKAFGLSFRDFLKNPLKLMPGISPNLEDWANHVGTLFPDTRLKPFLEIRGADTGPPERIFALVALYIGLLYDKVALDESWQLIQDWSEEERRNLKANVPRFALSTSFRNFTVLDLARQMLLIARNGLKRWCKDCRNFEDSSNLNRFQKNSCSSKKIHKMIENEIGYLDCLFSILESKKSPAMHLLELYHGKWKKSIDPIFESVI